ncbi:MAG TPA: CvpA family protein [Herpetosiphonaceae bacterium]
MHIVLDLLLIGVPGLLALLGFNRGIQREAMTLIGVLLGGMLAEIWGPVWGPALAQNLNKDPQLMRAIVSDGLLLFSAVFIGYGGGLLLPSRKKINKGVARFYGALGGVVNGLLILGLLLRYAELRAPEAAEIENIAATRLGPLLIERLPLMLLAGTGVGAAVVTVRLIQRILVRLHGTPKPADAAKPAQAKPAATPQGAGAAKPEAKPAFAGAVIAKPKTESKPLGPIVTPPADKPTKTAPTDNAILLDLLGKNPPSKA